MTQRTPPGCRSVNGLHSSPNGEIEDDNLDNDFVPPSSNNSQSDQNLSRNSGRSWSSLGRSRRTPTIPPPVPINPNVIVQPPNVAAELVQQPGVTAGLVQQQISSLRTSVEQILLRLSESDNNTRRPETEHAVQGNLGANANNEHNEIESDESTAIINRHRTNGNRQSTQSNPRNTQTDHRQVQFQVDGPGNSHVPSEQPSSLPYLDVPPLIRVRVLTPLPDGRMYEEHIFVSEEEYCQMRGTNTNSNVNTNRREPSRERSRSVSLGPINLTGNVASSTQRHSNESQRGCLSWRLSDSSDDEYERFYRNRSTRNTRSHRKSNDRDRRHHSRDRDRDEDRELNNDEQPSPMKIGQIVNTWKLSYPSTEKDPEQFLLLLKDQLTMSGINKDLFIPCLSAIFEGPYRAWYLVNKKSWSSWKDFVKAFRYEWSVKREDSDLLYEVRDLQIERSETLAEFASRARQIFEQMERPPEFKAQLRQIVTKFSPRLAFEILNLDIRNYTDFLHYVNKRNYIYKQCNATSDKMHTKTRKVPQLNQIRENYESEITESEVDEIEVETHSNQTPDLMTTQTHNYNKSKPLNRQRLEKNLQNFPESSSNQTNVTNSTNRQSKTFDSSKFFCGNCGQSGHTPRFCKNKREIVCCICREISHEVVDCAKSPIQGNSQSPQ